MRFKERSNNAREKSAAISHPLLPIGRSGERSGLKPRSFLVTFSPAGPPAPRLTASLLALRPPRRPAGSASFARSSLRSLLACSPSVLARARGARSRPWRAPRAGGAGLKKAPCRGGRSLVPPRAASLTRMAAPRGLSLAPGGARRARCLSRPPTAPARAFAHSSLPRRLAPLCARRKIVGRRPGSLGSCVGVGATAPRPCSWGSVCIALPRSLLVWRRFPLRPDGRTATGALTRAPSPSGRPHGRAGPRCPCCSSAARCARAPRRCSGLWLIGRSLRLPFLSAGALQR